MNNEATPAYLVAGSRPWCRVVFDETLSALPGRWIYVTPEDDLAALCEAHHPRYVFFLHWSLKVPANVIERWECVCFHMTDVPYGRGGSPLQNLIVRGHRETKLTALRMTEGIDAGPVYLKEPLLLDGSAEEIFLRANRLAAQMIQRIIAEPIIPSPQKGEVTVFKRRKPEESLLPESASLAQAHDLIRMLDAEGYPHAFINHGGLRLEFRRSTHHEDRVVAEVTIRPCKP